MFCVSFTNVNQINKIVLENRRLTIRELTDVVRLSEGSLKTIFKDHLCMKKVKSRLVPNKNLLVIWKNFGIRYGDFFEDVEIQDLAQ